MYHKSEGEPRSPDPPPHFSKLQKSDNNFLSATNVCSLLEEEESSLNLPDQHCADPKEGIMVPPVDEAMTGA